MSRVSRSTLAAIVLGAALRIAVITFFFGWDTIPTANDDGDYHRIAQGILRNGQIPTHHFPVGYPLFLAASLSLSGGSYVAVRVLQLILGALTVGVISRLTHRLYGRTAAEIAAWLTAVYPPLVYMTGRIMSETLFIFLLFSGLFLWIEADRLRSSGKAMVAAALIATSCLVRSNLLLLPLLIPLWQLVSWPRQRAALLRGLVLPTVLTALILLLPGIYFLVAHGSFMPTATNSGKTFYGANNSLVQGGWVSVDLHPELLRELEPEARTSESSYNRGLWKLGFRWIREHPGEFLGLLPYKLANAWVPGMQSSKLVSSNRVASLALMLSFGSLLVLGFLGILFARPAARDGLLLGVLGIYTFMSLVFYGNPRIGLFCAPVLIVYAAGLLGTRNRVSRLLPRWLRVETAQHS